jgi:hypothetical protein
MKNSVHASLNTLVDATTQTHEFSGFVEYVEENQQQIAQALQIIADTDSEEYLDVAHFTLWKVCPAEIESHVIGSKDVWFAVIQAAWNEYEQDCSVALDKWLEATKNPKSSKKGKKEKKAPGALPSHPDPKDVAHLQKCFGLS